MTFRLNQKAARKLGAKIQNARLKLGITLVKLGEACDVHHSQLSRIEHGKVTLVSKNIEQICTFLQIKIQDGADDIELSLPVRVQRLIEASRINLKAIESLVVALEEMSEVAN